MFEQLSGRLEKMVRLAFFEADVLNRLFHHKAHIFNIDGHSCRLKGFDQTGERT
jgi:hypothetical protein